MTKLAKGALMGLALATAASPALAADDTSFDMTFYAQLIAYVKAEFAYDGAEYTILSRIASPSELAALNSSKSDLYSTQLALIATLQTKITTS